MQCDKPSPALEQMRSVWLTLSTHVWKMKYWRCTLERCLLIKMSMTSSDADMKRSILQQVFASVDIIGDYGSSKSFNGNRFICKVKWAQLRRLQTVLTCLHWRGSIAHKQILMKWSDSQFPNKNKQTKQKYGDIHTIHSHGVKLLSFSDFMLQYKKLVTSLCQSALKRPCTLCIMCCRFSIVYCDI